MSYDNTSYNETISVKTDLAFKTVVVDLMTEIIAIMSEWNGDEAGELEDRFNMAQDLADQLQESIKLIDELN